MGRTGVCWDIAEVVSFWTSLTTSSLTLHHGTADVRTMVTSGRWIEQRDNVGFGTMQWMLNAVRFETRAACDGTSRQTAGRTVPGNPKAIAQTRCGTLLSLHRAPNQCRRARMCDRTFVPPALNGTAKHHLGRRRFFKAAGVVGLGVGATFFAGGSPALSASKIAIIEDPGNPGLFVATPPLTEDVANPGLFMVPGGGPLTEDPANPGLFMIGA